MTPDPRTLLEAALLAALASSPARLTGVTGRARALTPGYLHLLDHETAVRAALRRLHGEGWLAVTSPGANPAYALTPTGEQRHTWHAARGTLAGPG